MDGHKFFEWIMRQPDAKDLKARVLAAAHKAGYSPRIWDWSPAVVEEVRERLAKAPPGWGDRARASNPG
jgi:hypothetical protein